MRIIRLSAALGVALVLCHVALADSAAVKQCAVGSTPIKVPYPSSFVEAGVIPAVNEILREHNVLDGRLILCDFLAEADVDRVLSKGDFSIGRFASLQTIAEDPDHFWTQEEFALVKDAFRDLYRGDGLTRRLYTESANQIGFLEIVNYLHEGGWEKSLALSLNLVLANGKILFGYVYSDNESDEDLRFVQEVGERWGETILKMNPTVPVSLSQR